MGSHAGPDHDGIRFLQELTDSCSGVFAEETETGVRDFADDHCFGRIGEQVRAFGNCHGDEPRRRAERRFSRQSRSAGIESAAADHEEMPARVLVNVERLPRQIFPDVGFDGAFGIFGDFLHITRRNADVRDFDSAASAYAFLGKHTGFRQRHCDREIGSDRIAGDFPRIGVEPGGNVKGDDGVSRLVDEPDP